MFEELSTVSGQALLVEDVKANQIVIGDILKSLGFAVDVAENGQQGVQCAEEKDYDIIFMDLRMPVMDGFEAAERIYEHQKAVDKKLTPIIAVTAYDTKDYRLRALSCGMDDFIGKPVNKELMSLVLQQWLGPEEQVGIVQDLRRTHEDEDDVQVGGVSIEDNVVDKMIEDYEESAKEIFAHVLKDIKEKSALVASACDNNNYEQLSDIAHSLKSLTKTIGASKMYRICVNMEQMREIEDMVELKKLSLALPDEEKIISDYFEKRNLLQKI